MRRSAWLYSLAWAGTNGIVGGWALVQAVQHDGVWWVVVVANYAGAVVNIVMPIWRQRRIRRLQREYRESQESAARLGRDPEFQRALREALREIGEEV